MSREAVAFLYASSLLWTTLASDNETELDGRYLAAGTALYEAAFGEDSTQRHTSRTLVEAEARSHEIVADLLDLLAADVPNHRATAKRMREAGTIDVAFGEDARQEDVQPS